MTTSSEGGPFTPEDANPGSPRHDELLRAVKEALTKDLAKEPGGPATIEEARAAYVSFLDGLYLTNEREALKAEKGELEEMLESVEAELDDMPTEDEEDEKPGA